MLSAKQAVLHAMVREEMTGDPETIQVVREVRGEDQVVFAITYAEPSGRRRRGLAGVERVGEEWLPAGSCSGIADARADDAFWDCYGGWAASTSRVLGGWVADPRAVRLVAHDGAGRMVETDVVDRVAVLFLPGSFELAKIAATAADGTVLGETAPGPRT